jgi:membrane protein implicated in regulation of membrane protease activity
MRELLHKLDLAGESLHEGFLTTFLGRRGAALILLLLEMLVPPSFSNLAWMGPFAIGCTVLGVDEVPATALWLAAYVCATLAGVWSLYRYLDNMAQRPPGRRVEQ